MAVLTACWVIIETVIIPNGFRKWFCLSFFIHPSILFFCQIFLWLKLLIDCLIVVLVFPFRVVSVLFVYIFRPLRKCVIFFCSFIRLNKSSRVQEEVEQYFEAQPTFDFDQISYSNVLSSAASISCDVKLLKFEDDVLEEATDHGGDGSLLGEDENVDKAKSYLGDATNTSDDFFRCIYSSDESSSDDVEDSIPYENVEEPTYFYGREDTITTEYFLYGSTFVAEEYSNVKVVPLCASESPNRDDQYTNGYSPTAYSSNFQLAQRESFGGEAEEESDVLYKVYTERMRWFDVLNYDRTCGISAIENKQIGTPSPFKSIEYPDSDSGVSRISWSKMATRKLLRSFENEFEMVYVAQSCLTWKALYHQYTKVKAFGISSSVNSVFCSYVAGEFQKFHVLLSRYMENEQSEGTRVWNYVRERFSLKGLLQVPEVSVKGLMKEDKEKMKGKGTNIEGLLKVIEECIQVFWLFVKTDNSKKPWWKVKTSSWAYPPVEDPRDLELLADLTKRLQKNKLWLKDLEGKKRCLLKRIVNPVEDSQRQEMLFTMIDMKLVSRVLQMSMISSAQLKWCQDKLANVEFRDGKVFRASTDPLFPH